MSQAPPFFLGLEFDRSAWALLGANLLAIAIALALKMSLADMLVVYWMQSVIIGVCGCLRILCLKRFSSAGFYVTWGPVEETPKFRIQLALFFVVFYGTLHAMYLGGLVIFWDVKFSASPLAYALCAAVFVVNHGYSLRVNLRADAAGRPNIGTVTMMPILRIVPMHLTIILGKAVGAGMVAVALFLFLKTAMDVIMHCVEHKALRGRAPGAVYIS